MPPPRPTPEQLTAAAGKTTLGFLRDELGLLAGPVSEGWMKVTLARLVAVGVLVNGKGRGRPGYRLTHDGRAILGHLEGQS